MSFWEVYVLGVVVSAVIVLAVFHLPAGDGERNWQDTTNPKTGGWFFLLFSFAWPMFALAVVSIVFLYLAGGFAHCVGKYVLGCRG